jgi:hypothetical protein
MAGLASGRMSSPKLQTWEFAAVKQKMLMSELQKALFQTAKGEVMIREKMLKKDEEWSLLQHATKNEQTSWWTNKREVNQEIIC